LKPSSEVELSVQLSVSCAAKTSAGKLKNVRLVRRKESAIDLRNDLLCNMLYTPEGREGRPT